MDMEKCWAIMEEKLDHKTWSNWDELKRACEEAWAEATTPSTLRKLLGGLRATYTAVVDKDGAEVKGWGKKAK